MITRADRQQMYRHALGSLTATRKRGSTPHRKLEFTHVRLIVQKKSSGLKGMKKNVIDPAGESLVTPHVPLVISIFDENVGVLKWAPFLSSLESCGLSFSNHNGKLQHLKSLTSIRIVFIRVHDDDTTSVQNGARRAANFSPQLLQGFWFKLKKNPKIAVMSPTVTTKKL